jgi:threonine aldolase
MIDLTRAGDTSDAAVAKLAQAGGLVVPFGPRRLRAVTHLDVTRRDVERATEVITRALA